jgi:AMP nucleosidase
MQKADIVKDWIKRYTGTSSDEFGDWILLTNFQNYVDKFAEKYGVDAKGKEGPHDLGNQQRWC